jgi:hypothetical protein
MSQKMKFRRSMRTYTESAKSLGNREVMRYCRRCKLWHVPRLHMLPNPPKMKICPRCNQDGSGAFLKMVRNSQGTPYWYYYYAHRHAKGITWCYLGSRVGTSTSETRTREDAGEPR